MYTLYEQNQLPPCLSSLKKCKQNPLHHPEGNVLTHTGMVLDYFAANRTDHEYEDLVVGFACLLHDIGKPAVISNESSIEDDDFFQAHDIVGAKIAKKWLKTITTDSQLIDDVCILIKNHMVDIASCSDAGIRRLIKRVGNIYRLLRLRSADSWGRGVVPAKKKRLTHEKLLIRIKEMEDLVNRPKPIVMGRHLIELGMEPGPQMGKILATFYTLQLEGKITTLEEAAPFLVEIILGRTTIV